MNLIRNPLHIIGRCSTVLSLLLFCGAGTSNPPSAPDVPSTQVIRQHSVAGVMRLIISSSRFLGSELLQKHKELARLNPEAKLDRRDLQNTILYATGRAISGGLRAYFVVGDSRFYFTPFCNPTKWILENIRSGLLADPPQPYFPADLYALEYTHLISDWPLLDPLEAPYTSLEDKYETVVYSGEAPSIEFRPGRVVYIPLGWKNIEERKRPTGFILLVFGNSPDARPQFFYKGSVEFATRILKKIPPGVLYIDAVDPQLTRDLYDAGNLSPRAVYEALGYPYLDPAYDLNPLLATSPEAVPYYAYYFSPESELLIQVSTTVDFDSPDRFGQDISPGPHFLSIDVNSLDVVLTVLRGGNSRDAYIDWGDGTGDFVNLHPNLAVRHEYPYHTGYYISIFTTEPVKLVARFKVFVSYIISASFQPKEPPEDYLPAPPATMNEELNKALAEAHRWNRTSRLEEERGSDITSVSPS